jgi:hypothetical protein
MVNMRRISANARAACLVGSVTFGLVFAALPAAMAKTKNIVISDGTFSTWSFGSYIQGSGGSATMAVDSSAGNPAPGLQNIVVTGGTGSYAAGYGADEGDPISQNLDKAKYVMTVQFESGAGAPGVGQGIQLIVEQQGTVYQSHGYRNSNTSKGKYKTITLKGKLVGTSFNNISGSGPAQPDFTSGIPTIFGFSGQDYQSNRSVTLYFDNYNLTITPK